MAKADIWMPLYIGDYLADTTRLTTEQHGAYLLLIMDYWRNGPPPDDDIILCSVCRANAQSWKKLRPVMVRFFEVRDANWHHSRIDREIADAAKAKDKAVSKASKGAEARWGKHAAEQENNNAPSISSSNAPSNASSISQAMLEQCSLPSPSLNSKTKSKADATASRLPADWQPDERQIEFCSAERPDLDPMTVADRFRDYWIAVPGVKGRKTDWMATWRNWVRSERQQARASPERPKKFDPTAYVNRNKTRAKDERTIEFDQHGEPI
ncbi:MAG: hypothetical protein JWP38_3720 [Herbaspirillum sp.]|nr:hypothetical protein [Herbaspirillum sp.]